MGIKFTKPKFKKTRKWLDDRKKGPDVGHILEEFGARGVAALRSATPEDTGETANAWSYVVSEKNGVYKIHWTNSVMAGSVPLVVILQYGHATGTGGFVYGKDYINPALDPVFEGLKLAIAAEVINQ